MSEQLDIGSLLLSIETDSTSVAKGFDKLVTSLSALKTVVGGVNFGGFATQIRELVNATTQIQQQDIMKLDALGGALSKLSAQNRTRIPPTLARSVMTMGSAVRSLNGVNMSPLMQMGSAIRSLNGIGNIRMSSTLGSTVNSIGDAVRKLNGVPFGEVLKLSSALRNLVNIPPVRFGRSVSDLELMRGVISRFQKVDFGGLLKLNSAIRPLSNIKPVHLMTFVNQLPKLARSITEFNKIDMTAFEHKMKSLLPVLQSFERLGKLNMNGVVGSVNRLQKIQSRNVGGLTGRVLHSRVFNTINALYLLKRAFAGLGMSIPVGNAINLSNEFVETLNLFTVALGKFAPEAREYADIVSDAMGIDPAEWMRNQGLFMMLATGFGVASDRAYIMSKNLTQLGYDLASFENLPIQDAFQKLQSGLAGELEPLRRVGYDLSQVRLEQEAVTLGITKRVSAMTQAEKAELRYHAILTQVTQSHGDMARTLNAPANQLRVFRMQVVQTARAFGNIFIPVLNKTLPYLIAIAQVLRMVFDIIAKLFHFKLPHIDYSSVSVGMGGVADKANDIGNGLGHATKRAKEFKSAMLGIDELNVIAPPEPSHGGGGGGGGSAGFSGGGFDFPLPEYDFLKGLSRSTDGIVGKMREWLGIAEDISSWSEFFQTRLGHILIVVGAIGAGITAWKIGSRLVKGVIAVKNAFGAIRTFVGSVPWLTNAFEALGTAISSIGATNLITIFAGVAGAITYLVGRIKMFREGLSMTSGSVTVLGSTVLGATIGSIVPGVGTALGALGGLCVGVRDMFRSILFDNKRFRVNLRMDILKMRSTIKKAFGVIFSKKSAQEVGGSLGKFFGNLARNAITGIVKFGASIVQGIKNMVLLPIRFIFSKDERKKILDSISTMFEGLIDDTLNGLNSLGYAVTDTIGLLFFDWWHVFDDGFVEILKWVGEMGRTFKDDFKEAFKSDEFKEAAKNIVNEFIQGIKDKYAEVKKKVEDWGSDVVAWFKEHVNYTSFKTTAQSILNGFIQGVRDKYYAVKDKVVEIARNVKDWFEDKCNFRTFLSIGTDIMNGIKKGISDKINDLKTAVSGVATKLPVWVKKLLGIKSPSRVFAEIAHFTMDGFIVGIHDKLSETKRTMSGWVGTVSGYKPTITYGYELDSDGTLKSARLDKTLSQNMQFAYSQQNGNREDVLDYLQAMIQPLLSRIADNTQHDDGNEPVLSVDGDELSNALNIRNRRAGYKFT